MSLAPAVTLTLGNLRYTSHVASASVTLGLLPSVNEARVTLPATASVTAAPGDDGALEIDGGEGSQTILTGKIDSLAFAFETVSATLVDGGGALARYRPASTYSQQDAQDVVQAIAGDAGVTVGNVTLALPLPEYVAHQSRTAAEHIALLTRLAGGIASFDGDGSLNAVAPMPEQADIALLYGREITECHVRVRHDPAFQRFAIGSGPAGAINDPTALVLSTDPLPGDAALPGTGSVWQATSMLRTPDAVSTASSALQYEDAARTHEIDATAFLLPSLRPGMVVDIQQLPGSLADGPWLVTSVRHRLSPSRGGSTRFTGRKAGSPSSLAGSLLSAAAGLL